jgi:hypothetical protein
MYIPTLGVRMLKMSLNSELARTNTTLAYKTGPRDSLFPSALKEPDPGHPNAVQARYTL